MKWYYSQALEKRVRITKKHLKKLKKVVDMKMWMWYYKWVAAEADNTEEPNEQWQLNSETTLKNGKKQSTYLRICTQDFKRKNLKNKDV